MDRTASDENVGNDGGPGNVGRIVVPMTYEDFDPVKIA